MLTDIEIAQNAEIKPITEIAGYLDINSEYIECYGRYKAKISEEFIKKSKSMKNGRLILVTAVNPTPAGEGKTTVSVGLGDALHRLGKKTVLALREPSLGPVFGIKGGAAGGGYAQVIPMEDINLHFTGDMHAVTAANNLLCTLLDNHMHQGNELKIDQRQIYIKRCLDMNDRSLRNIVIGMGKKTDGIPRQDSFQITVASEVMAVLCLANDLTDLKERLGNILVANSTDGNPVYARDLKAEGAMTALLKDALKPNLVQTLEHTPALLHGGPFANIAHGCNSIRATDLALKLGDYCVTEAGFGSDLGAEKFFDIKSRYGGLKPDCTVLVATVKALKYNGKVKKENLSEENLDALADGIINLKTHIENIRKFNVPVVVALNRFNTDTDAEISFVKEYCNKIGAEVCVCEVFARGSEGGLELAEKVIEITENSKNLKFEYLYPLDLSVKEKIFILAREIYRASNVRYTAAAEKALDQINRLGYDNLPVCVAKTQYSLSDDPAKLGKPENYAITVSDMHICSGAGFIVVYMADIMTMPGLPKKPAANNIDCDENGKITGLF